MKCPVCDVTLVISSREGIEIDHCPQCRGVWLDRGELDKIIDRAAPAAVGNAGTAVRREPDWDDRPPPRRDHPDDRYRDDRYRDERSYDDRRAPRKRRRGSFLEDLFDFD